MKKILLILSLFGCCIYTITQKMDWQVPIPTDYIEIVPSNALPFLQTSNENTILLNSQEIEEYNQTIAQKTDTLYELDNIKNLSKEEIIAYIDAYQIPSLPMYHQGKSISSSDVELILANRNLEAIQNKTTLLRAIVIQRSNLKSFPTDIHFYDTPNQTNFDQLQETELHINTPLFILHESKDQNWFFVLSPIYAGWVKKEDVAYANEEDWNYFIHNQSFGVITEPSLNIENTILDMGVTLPYIQTTKEGYQLALPVKDENNYVARKIITISREKTHIGYLPYTKRNLIVQAFKYEGTPYSWGGMDSGVDCSSYISNIYRTFGFVFPRNTSSQKESVGKIISMSGKTNEEKKLILQNHDSALLYQPGHVMLYIGKKDGIDYVIHASGTEMKVVVTNIDTYLSKIDRIVVIAKS